MKIEERKKERRKERRKGVLQHHHHHHHHHHHCLRSVGAPGSGRGINVVAITPHSPPESVPL
jgi:hypothetical protein